MILYSQTREQNDCREGDVNGMKREYSEYLQCCNCGHIHKQQIQCNDDDLYIDGIECEKCRQEVKHLRCGEDQSEVYMYYDSVLDERFYLYKTK